MESIEMPKYNIPGPLREALSSLSDNGDPGWMNLWLKKNGIQSKQYTMSPFARRQIHNIIMNDMEWIEKKLNYKSALYRWKLLNQSGLLTADILKAEIENYMRINMLRTPEEIEVVKSNTGTKLTHYSKEFIEEFKKDLHERIKNEVGLEVEI